MTDFALLGIKVDSKEVRKANKDLDAFTKGSVRATRGTKQFESASKRLEKQLAKTLGPLRQMRNLLIGVGITQTAKGLVHVADQFVLINARVKTVTDSLEEQKFVMQSLRDSANEVGVSMESAAKLFIRTQRVRKDIGATTQDVLKFVQTIQRLTLISGASAQESTAAMIQLSQAIASSRLSGEELRSVMEQVPVIVKTITDEYDITLAQFRKLAEQGEITADVMVTAINNASVRVAQEAAKMPDTVGRAFMNLRNEFQALTGEINKEFNVTGRLAAGIRSLAGNLETVADIVLVLAGYLGVRLVQAIIGATVATVKGTIALKAEVTARIAATAATLAHVRARQAELVIATGHIGVIGKWGKKQNELVRSTGRLERATTKYNKALKAAIPLTFLGRASRLLGIFGGLPGVIAAAAGALWVWNQRTKDAEERAEKLKEKLLNLGKSQVELAKDIALVTKTMLEQERAAARIEAKEAERKIRDLERRRNRNIRGPAAHQKAVKTRLQEELDAERKSLEEWQLAIEKVTKAIDEAGKKKPEDLAGALDHLLGGKGSQGQKTLEQYIEKLSIARDEQERMAEAVGQGEIAVAALNDELEIENALRGAGTTATLDQEAAIVRIVMATQAETKAINETKDARRKAAEAAEEAAEAAKEAASEIQEPFDRAAENIQRGFGNAFTEAFRHGKLEFESFADLVKDIMARLAGEMAALLVFRPQLLGGLGLFGSSAAGAAGGTAGGALAGGGALSGLLAHPALLGVGGALGGTYLSGGFGSTAGTAGGLAGGLLGAGAGAYLGFALGGPLGSLGTMALGSALGGFGGGLLGGGIGSLFGGGNDKQKFGFNTGAGGVQTPFGGLSVSTSKNIDADAIVRSLAGIDKSIAKLLDPDQIARVRGALSGTGQFFSAHSFDNESFDVVKTRLVRIIDAVSENTVASGLLNQIGRDPGNIDQLVGEAGRIIELINMFGEQGEPLNDAEVALQAITEQFRELSDVAVDLGFSVEEVNERLAKATQKLTTDFNTSITDQILAIEEPLIFALESVERVAKDRLANAVTLGADLVDVERLNALERQQVLDRFAADFMSANASLLSVLTSLKTTSAGGLSLGSQINNSESVFNQLLSDARSDPSARSSLASFLPGFIDLKREQLGSSAEFFEFTNFLDSTVRGLVDQRDTVSTLQDVGAAITTGDNAIVTALQEEIGSLKQEIVEMNADIKLLLNAPAAA